MNAPQNRYLELVFWKALAELKAEAERAYIGILWWIAEPVFYMGAFYVAFGSGLRAGGVRAVPFLLCGLVVWKWFAGSVQSGSGAIQANSGLIQQVYLPKAILPLIVLFTNTVKFFIVFSLLIFLLVLMGYPPNVTWLALPVLIAVEFLLIAAIGSLAASLLPLFPDLKLIIDNGLIVVMFMSGIFFDVNRLPRGPAAIVHYNPMAAIIEGFRAVLMKHVWPNWGMLGAVAAFGAVTYVSALMILTSYNRHYAKLMIG